MEVDFPRGGGGNELTPLEHREVIDQAKREIFKSEKSSKKKRMTFNEDEEEVAKKIKVSEIAMLTFKQIKKGLVMMGVVKKINELDMEISLPNQLTGYCSLTEISDYVSAQVELIAESENDDEMNLPDLSEMFQVGQIVVCTAISVEQGEKKRIDLSLNPKLVNAYIDNLNVVVGAVLKN